jgi:RimJ/RimL family protein N-acetyltransferase
VKLFREVTDTATLLKYWDAEHQFPQWFVEANDVWIMTEELFLGFCQQCWKIYEVDGQALVYVEKIGDNAEIHVSVLRGIDVQTILPSLIELRNEVLKHCEMLFGWMVRQNKGMQRVAEAIGMKFYGLKMFHGAFHGRVIEWRCYSMLKTDIFIIENP